MRHGTVRIIIQDPGHGVSTFATHLTMDGVLDGVMEQAGLV
jgi:hypothetical protein